MKKHLLIIIILILTLGCVTSEKNEVVAGKPTSPSPAPKPVEAPKKVETPQPEQPKESSFFGFGSGGDSSSGKSAWSPFIKNQDWASIESMGLKALQDNPKEFRALNALGLSNYYQNKPLAARYYFNKALEVSPGNGAILNNLGLVAYMEGKPREAMSYWRQAAESKSGRSQAAQGNLVTEFAKAKDYKKIMGAAERIDIRKVEDIALLVNLGIGYMAQNQHGMAERAFSRAYELDDSNVNVLLNYAILNIEHEKNLDLGRRQLDRLSFLGVQSDMQVTLNRLEKKLEGKK